MIASPVSEERFHPFDGLRALAFLMVFAHHAFQAPLLWVGVDLFFALSGFLITGRLLASQERRPPGRVFSVFYFRRALRILPPYALALAAILVFEESARSQWAWYASFLGNVKDASWGRTQGALGPLWSIAVEEQFYLVWPLILLLVPRQRLPIALMALIAAAPLARWVAGSTLDSYVAVYRLMPCRLDLLAGGALLAWVQHRRPGALEQHRAWAVSMLALSLFVFASLAISRPDFRTSANEVVFNTLGYALIAAAAVATIWIVHTLRSGWLHAALGSVPLRSLGRVSYMMYLVHGLVLVKTTALTGAPLQDAAAALVLTVAVAALSWVAVERPLLALKARHV